MKKFAILAVIAVAATLSSCFNKAPKADLKEELDTLSYAAGLAQTQGLKRYLVEQVGMDTTYIDEFVKGLLEGAQADDSPKTKAYYAGVQIGQQISGQIIKNLNYQLFGEDSVSTVSLDNFMAGFIAGTTEKGGLMTVEEADSTFMTKLQSFRARQIEKEYAEWKQQNIDFMVATAKKDGILSLGDGIFYTVETEGKGAVPADSNLVKVHYEGKLIDGTAFDSSYKRNEPLTIRPTQVIPGWGKALTSMPVGSKWTVYIPQEQGYGSRDMGTIKPFSALVFTIELLSIEK